MCITNTIALYVIPSSSILDWQPEEMLTLFSRMVMFHVNTLQSLEHSQHSKLHFPFLWKHSSSTYLILSCVLLLKIPSTVQPLKPMLEEHLNWKITVPLLIYWVPCKSILGMGPKIITKKKCYHILDVLCTRRTFQYQHCTLRS